MTRITQHGLALTAAVVLTVLSFHQAVTVPLAVRSVVVVAANAAPLVA